MNPFFLFPIALLTPFALALSLFAPVYVGMLAGCYLVYKTSPTAHLLLERAYDVPYIFSIYQNLFDYWSSNEGLSFIGVTLPVCVLPGIGAIIGFWLVAKVTRRLLNLFHLSAPVE